MVVGCSPHSISDSLIWHPFHDMSDIYIQNYYLIPIPSDQKEVGSMHSCRWATPCMRQLYDLQGKRAALKDISSWTEASFNPCQEKKREFVSSFTRRLCTTQTKIWTLQSLFCGPFHSFSSNVGTSFSLNRSIWKTYFTNVNSSSRIRWVIAQVISF
jgi:hypothetical protein